MPMIGSLLVALAIPAGITVYASPNGQASASGTQAQPVRTVEQALAIVRHRRSGGQTAATISLAPGDYPVRDTIELGVGDGNLTISGGGRARLLGGQIVSQWKPVEDRAILARLAPEARTAVRVVGLPAGVSANSMTRRGFGIARSPAPLDLFFNHRPMQIARWPNKGWVKTERPDSDAFRFSSLAPRPWAQPETAWAYGYWNHDWAGAFERVADFKRDGNEVRLAYVPPYGIKTGRRFYLLNVLEELDAPGEWFLDAAKRRLYFWPPSAPKESFVSQLGGPMFAAQNVSGLRVTGLRLEGGRDGAVLIQGGTNNRIEKSVIRGFGTFGVKIVGATSSGAAGCDLTDLGESGVELSGGDRRSLTPGKLYAENNRIWNYGRWVRSYAPAVKLQGVGNRASHNEISDAPHSAVIFEGNDQVVEFNDIRRVCLETLDAGAIYSTGRDLSERGTTIRSNRFREIQDLVGSDPKAFVCSIYLDSALSGVQILGNLFEGPGVGVLVNSGWDNLVFGNIFVRNRPGVLIAAADESWKPLLRRGGGWRYFEKGDEMAVTRAPYSKRYPRIAAMLQGDITVPRGNKVIENISIGGGVPTLYNGLAVHEVEIRGNRSLSVGTVGDALELMSDLAPIKVDGIGTTTKTRPLGSG